ncbi:MAG: hypothetical protein ABEN55_00575 [Bradymonadaceae bacterium]
MPHSKEDVTRRRYDAGQWKNGHYQEGSPTTTTIQAYVEPADGSEAERLPEGQRSRVRYFISTTDDIRGIDQKADEPADEIVYNGEVFEVSSLSEPGTFAPFGQNEAFLLRTSE